MARKLLGDYINRHDLKIAPSARSTKVMNQDGKLIAIVRDATKFTDLPPRVMFDSVHELRKILGKTNAGITSELIQDADGKFYHLKKDKTLETVQSYANSLNGSSDTLSRGTGDTKTGKTKKKDI